MVSCSGQKQTEMEERVKNLGVEIFQFAQNGNYNASLPQDLVFIGNNTFWNILEITEPVDSIEFTVHDAKGIDDKADYLLDIGSYIGLRIKYDKEIDKFHIIGYHGTQTKVESSRQNQIFELDQDLYKVGNIRPGIGLDGFEINESTEKEIFKKYDEQMFNRLGIWFEFQNDTLKSLYISKYQLKTENEIRPETSSKSEILTKYGTPHKTRSSFTFLNKDIKNIDVLEYEGIEFVILKDELMVIKVK